MADMDSNVQSGTVSDGTVPPVAPPPAPVVFDEAKVKELLSSEIEKVTRRFQSEKDKTISEVKRESERAISAARREAESAYGQLNAVDPQAAELARLRSRDATYRDRESEEAVRKQTAEFDEQFRGSLTESLVDMEIDPSDARIDWATDATNYVERQKRILKSAAKIAKERQTKVQEELSKKLSDDITARVKKDLGVDSVDTSTPPTATSTQVFKESEIADPRFWAEHKSEILKAQREGRIKIGE